MGERVRIKRVQVGADADKRVRRVSPCTKGQRLLIDRHLGLAKEGARRYTHAHRLGDEAHGIAALALVLAAQDWDREREPVFENYARKRIKNELATAMKEVYHRRGYDLNSKDQPKHVAITGNADRPNEVSDVTDHRTWRDVDQEDEVCWLLSRLTPEQAGMLRQRFWNHLEVSDLARERGVAKSTARRAYDNALAYLREEIFTSYRRTPGAYELLPVDKAGRERGAKALIRWEGRDWTLSEITDRLGLPYDAIRWRICVYKWPVERALTEPVNSPPRKREKSVS